MASKIKNGGDQMSNVYVSRAVRILTRMQAFLCLTFLVAQLVDFGLGVPKSPPWWDGLNEESIILSLLMIGLYCALMVILVFGWCRVTNLAMQASVMSTSLLTLHELWIVIKTGKKDGERLFATFLDFSGLTIVALLTVYISNFMLFPAIVSLYTPLFLRVQAGFALILATVLFIAWSARAPQKSNS